MADVHRQIEWALSRNRNELSTRIPDSLDDLEPIPDSLDDFNTTPESPDKLTIPTASPWRVGVRRVRSDGRSGGV